MITMNRFFLHIQCVISFSALVSCTWGAHVDPNDSYNQAKYVQRKWITQLMDEAKYKFDFDSTVNEKCHRDIQLYQQHLQNLSIWAVRSMYTFFIEYYRYVLKACVIQFIILDI